MYTELPSNVHTSLLFKGVLANVTDLPEIANFGDVWCVGTTDNTYVYSGTDWVCMSDSDSESTAQIRTPHHDPVAQICTQCHGTLELDKFGGLHCPYCGTIYR